MDPSQHPNPNDPSPQPAPAQAANPTTPGLNSAALPVAQSPAPSSVTTQPQITPAQPFNRTTLPPELKGFNWGGFFLSWIWGIGNKVWISLLAFVPGANLIMAIILGVMGNELAWKAKQWDSIEHFKTVQRKWKIAGIIYFVVMVLVLGLLFIFIMLGIASKKNTSTQVTTGMTKRGTKVTTLQQIPNGYKDYISD